MPKLRTAAVALAAVLSFWSTSLRAAAPDANQHYGMGFTQNTYWERLYYFNNALLQTNQWLNSTPTNLPTDADGWPTSLNGSTGVGIPLFLSNNYTYPTGEWVLEWDGTGDLDLLGHGGSPNPPLVSSSSNRKVYNVATATYAGFRVVWNSTAAAPNNVRNVRVWMPGQEDATTILHPDIVADHAGLQVYRAMDLGQTNSSSQVTWSDRTLPGAPIQRPLAWEHIIAIANELDCDLWLCVPHQADDDYVEHLAALVHSNLDSGLKVWVEYSNEVWNTGGNFQQTNWVNANLPGANLDERYALRSSDIFDIFATEFGSLDRVVRVIATQAMNPNHAWLRLNAVNGNVDVLAITSYYGNGGQVSTWVQNNWPVTNAQFADYLLNTDIIGSRVPNWDDNADYADTFGVDLVTYEGNSHIVAQNFLTTAQRDFIAQFHVSQENATLYRYTLDYLTSIGLQTHVGFTNYNTPENEYFGHREYPGQSLSTAHLWRELLDWADDQGTTVGLDVVETFDNASLASSFGSGTFTGTGGLDWSYAGVKASTQITGPTAWLNDGGIGTVSTTLTAPINSLSLDVSAHQNDPTEIALRVNSVQVATSGSITPAEGVVNVVFGSLSLQSNDVVELVCIATGAGQADIDNIHLLGGAGDTVPDITTTSLPDGETGTAYSQTLNATGGNGTLTWSVASGSLPTGLSLSSGGVLSGTPTTAATSNFVVEVEDVDTDTDTQSLSLLIASSSASTLETFDNASLPTSFGSGSFTGDGGVPWSYVGIKTSTAIDGPTAWLNDGGIGVLSTTLTSPVDDISFDVSAHQGDPTEIVLRVNSVQVATSGSISPAAGVVNVSFTSLGLSTSDVIDLVCVSLGSAQADIDNIALD